jgi:hypothetical protein
MAAAQVLHECVPGRDDAQRGDRFQPAHRAKPRFEPTVVGFHRVIRVLLKEVPSAGQQIVDNPRVNRRSVGGDLHRGWPESLRAGEECPCGRTITAFRDQFVDDLAVLIDRAVKISPAAGDLDVGLIDEPPIAHRVSARTGGGDKLQRERLHPPVYRHVVDFDAPFSEQLLDIAIGQP